MTVMLRLIGFYVVSVMKFQSTDADVICTQLTVLKNDALMPPFQLYRGVQPVC